MEKIIAIGAGAIGKSIAGYVFGSLGFEVCYFDVVAAAVDDLNRRRSYRIFKDENDPEPVSVNNVSAYLTTGQEDECIALIEQVSYLCTAVGPNGLRGSAPLIAKGIKSRNEKGIKEPLYILLCENFSGVYDYMLSQMAFMGLTEEELKYVHFIECSIERMTKPFFKNEGEGDVIAEPFIPVIFSESRIGDNTFFRSHPEYFNVVSDFDAYYHRKLYTNNMGHAVLGYAGFPKGYRHITEAIKDKELYELLEGALEESGRMMVKKYGFSEKEISDHLKSLMKRYDNIGLNDELARLIRQPIKKIGREERLCGTALLCLSYGIDPSHIVKTIVNAIYCDIPGDAEAEQLHADLAERGITFVLKQYCGLSPEDELYNKILCESKNIQGGK